MFRQILTIALATAAAAALAVPAKRGRIAVRQADGTELALSLIGDEHCHYYTDDNGTPYKLNPQTRLWERETAVQPATQRRRQADRQRTRRLSQFREAATNGTAVHGLVILAEFSDQTFSDADPKATWSAILNQEGYTNSRGAIGSVRDYYLAQSHGQFDLTFDVIGPVRLSKSKYYYGQNDHYGNDRYAGEMVAEAINAVADKINPADYDWNGDLFVDQVFVLFAGCCEATTGNDSRLIWPHEYWLQYCEGCEDGVKLGQYSFDQYACGQELEGQEGSSTAELSGLGTFCHEFSHCLGLPDTYNTLSPSSYDLLEQYDVMASGLYNKSSWVPCGYTAYEKSMCGWADPVELDAAATVSSLTAMAEGGRSYSVRSTSTDPKVDEYYLLENRQKKGWDAGIPAAGLMIMHVDYDSQKWYDNEVNGDPAHYGLAYIPANNGKKAGTGTPYPYGQKKELTDTSVPAAKLYHPAADGRKLMGKPITDITDNRDGTISFQFCGGGAEMGVSAPQAEPAADSPWYGLSGVKALTPAQHGVYVRGGKKVVK